VGGGDFEFKLVHGKMVYKDYLNQYYTLISIKIHPYKKYSEITGQ